MSSTLADGYPLNNNAACDGFDDAPNKRVVRTHRQTQTAYVVVMGSVGTDQNG